MNTAFKTKSATEFLLSNVACTTQTVYSPPFATSHDMFWQLEFMPVSSEAPEFCAAFLFAIPSQEEERCSGIWNRRNTLTARLYLKNARTNVVIKKQDVTMNAFSAKLSGWGWGQFYKRVSLPDQVMFGVEFERCEIGTVSQTWPLPSTTTTVPDDLVSVWEAQLNNVEFADVRFKLKGRTIYANSAILSGRSCYFNQLFQGLWAESDASKDSSSSKDPHSPKCKHVIEVSDFHYETFYEMLRFLYTNRVSFKDDSDNANVTALDLYRIADKYLIEELRERAKAELFSRLNLNNAAEFLFENAFRYPELRNDVMRFVVQNFVAVRQTPGFRKVIENPTRYESFSELMYDILAELRPGSAVENTGKAARDDPEAAAIMAAAAATATATALLGTRSIQ